MFKNNLWIHSKKHGLQIFSTETQKTQNVVINILTIAYIYFIFREFCAFVVKLTSLEWNNLYSTERYVCAYLSTQNTYNSRLPFTSHSQAPSQKNRRDLFKVLFYQSYQPFMVYSSCHKNGRAGHSFIHQQKGEQKF
jgi:hypothetical protein